MWFYKNMMLSKEQDCTLGISLYLKFCILEKFVQMEDVQKFPTRL